MEFWSILLSVHHIIPVDGIKNLSIEIIARKGHMSSWMHISSCEDESSCSTNFLYEIVDGWNDQSTSGDSQFSRSSFIYRDKPVLYIDDDERVFVCMCHKVFLKNKFFDMREEIILNPLCIGISVFFCCHLCRLRNK